MNTEIEIKILNVDPKNIRSILLKNKAKPVKNVFQKNHIYTNEYVKSNDILVRLREEGKNYWLTIKSPAKIIRNHKIRKEYELMLPSYKDGYEMLTLQGFKESYVVEVKREYFSLYSCSVEIIVIPTIPTFIEIEGLEKNISRVAKLLGYSNKDYVSQNIFKIYKLKRQSFRF